MDDLTKTPEPALPRRKRLARGGNILIVLLLAGAIVVPMYSDDARHHVLGCTLILHRDGRIVIRPPSNQLWECDLFKYINSGIVCMLSALYVMGWMVHAMLKSIKNRKRIEPRGFPLDWPEK